MRAQNIVHGRPELLVGPAGFPTRGTPQTPQVHTDMTKNRRCPPGHVWMPWSRQCKPRKRRLKASADNLAHVLGVARAVKARYSVLAEQLKEARRGES